MSEQPITRQERDEALMLEASLFALAGEAPRQSFRAAVERRFEIYEKHGEIRAYLLNRYCPRCGARKLLFDALTTYTASSITSRIFLICNQCRSGFSDTRIGRWLVIKFDGTSAMKQREGHPTPGQFAAQHPRNLRICKRAGVPAA